MTTTTRRRTTTRVLTALLATVMIGVALIAPAGTAQAAGLKITGRWVGTVKQAGFDDYRVRVRIFRNDAGQLRGRVVYPNQCSGVWKFRKRENGWTKFTEVITDDPGTLTCVPRLRVKVKRVDAKLRIVWTYDGKTSTTLAHRP